MCNNDSTDFYAFADFVPLSNTECVFSVVALRVLWSVAAIANSISLLIVLHALWTIIATYQKQRGITKSTAPSGISSNRQLKAANEEGGSKLVIISTQGGAPPSPRAISTRNNSSVARISKLKLGIVFCSIISSVFFLTVGIWKAYDKDRNVGVDIPIGVLFLLANLFWFSSVACLFVFFLRLQMNNAQMKRREWKERLFMFTYRILPVLFVLTGFSGASTGAMYINSDSLTLSRISVGLTFGILSLVLLGLNRALLYLIMFPLKHDLTLAIESSSTQSDALLQKRNEEMKALLVKITFFSRINQVLPYVNLPLMATFAFVPFMQLRVGYFIPILVTVAAVLHCKFVRLKEENKIGCC